MRKEIFVAVGAVFLAGNSLADILLFDIGADPHAWADAINSKFVEGGWYFDNDADYGITSFAGPLTSAGSGPVSPLIIASERISMSAPNNEGSGNSLVAVGPSAGLGNGSNFVGANYFTDSFVINIAPIHSYWRSAIEFSATSLLGSNSVDLFVNGKLLSAGSDAPASGHRYGILATSNSEISSVRIFDTGGGIEGIQDSGLVYVSQGPAPGAIALLGIGGLVLHRRRR